MFKKCTCLTMVLLLCFSFTTPAFAASDTPPAKSMNTLMGVKSSNISLAERKAAAKNGLEIIEKITDPGELQTLVD